MTVNTDPKTIEWLIEKLYQAKRCLESGGVKNETFVFFCGSIEERFEVERRIMNYLCLRYGIDGQDMPMKLTDSCKELTRFELPYIGSAVILLSSY